MGYIDSLLKYFEDKVEAVLIVVAIVFSYIGAEYFAFFVMYIGAKLLGDLAVYKAGIKTGKYLQTREYEIAEIKELLKEDS
jgi:hypothetical protein